MGLTATLPLLAVLNVVCAWQVRRVATHSDAADAPRTQAATLATPEVSRPGLTVLARSPYLRNLAALVLLGTMAATFFDYLFQVQAVETLGRGDDLLRFFAAYYAAVSVLAFGIQISVNRLALEKLGLALTVGTPSLAMMVASVGAWLAPGLASATTARGSEAALRGSLFRSSYEIFYTPVPSADKRAAKSIIDVGFDRLGDACGGGAITLILLLPLAFQYNAILGLAAVIAAGTFLCARRLNHGYVQMLERSLRSRAVELDLGEIEDLTTRTTMLRTLATVATLDRAHVEPPSEQPQPTAVARAEAESMASFGPDTEHILTLRSRDRHRIRALLRSDQDWSATLVPHVVPLLAWDAAAADAAFALGRVAEVRVGQLIDVLTDRNTELAVRRRLARILARCTSQRAADGLLLGLNDARFDVRHQCARSLATIVQKNPSVTVDRDRVLEIIRRETTVGRAVWRSERLLQTPEDSEGREAVFVDEFVKDRASRSLGHIFTLLSLVLPAEPLSIAFRGLHTDDARLRGTALEYLEGMLPPVIRELLWPFLEDPRPTGRSARPREEVLDELLRSNHSIALNIEEIRRRSRTT